MFKKRDMKEISFYAVGLAVIVLGAGIFAVGLVEYLFNLYWSGDFVSPSIKVIGGAIVTMLGYIQIELELIRKSR